MSEVPDQLGFELPAAAQSSRGRVLVVIALIAGGGFAFGYLEHHKARGDTVVAHGELGAVHVEVIKPTALTSDRALTLPGVVKALEETQIYPRTTGYVKR